MKCLEERLEECMNLRIQIRNLGIEAHHAEELKPLFRIMDTFARYGTGASGTIKIDANEFTGIRYDFVTDPKKASCCNITR
jgi:hypothetical protein